MERLKKRREIIYGKTAGGCCFTGQGGLREIFEIILVILNVYNLLYFTFSVRKTLGLNSIYLKSYVKIRLKCFPKIQYFQLPSLLVE